MRLPVRVGYPRYEQTPTTRGPFYGQSVGARPGGDGRARGAPLPDGAYVRTGRRVGLRASPRGLRDGDAPVRGAYPGPGEHARAPGGLRGGRPGDEAAKGVGQGGTVGGRGRLRLRRPGLPLRLHSRARGRQDVARHALLRRALRGAGVAGPVGRADGSLGSEVSISTPENTYPLGAWVNT